MRATRFLVLLLVVSCQQPDAVQPEPSIEDQSQQARADWDCWTCRWRPRANTSALRPSCAAPTTRAPRPPAPA